MKRKIRLLIISTIFITMLAACNKNNIEKGGIQPTQESSDENSTDSKMPRNESSQKENTSHNILIVYFSRADNIDQTGVDASSSASINIKGDKIIGNMGIFSGYIQEILGGDLFPIQTVELYSQDYRTTTDQALQEQKDDSRPELLTHVEDIDKYDIIFLGYPNWWGTIPMPVYTFLEEYDFTEKTIIPFSTHEGSGLGNSIEDIKSLCPDADVLDGLAVRGGDIDSEDAKNSVNEWLLGIDQVK